MDKHADRKGSEFVWENSDGHWMTDQDWKWSFWWRLMVHSLGMIDSFRVIVRSVRSISQSIDCLSFKGRSINIKREEDRIGWMTNEKHPNESKNRWLSGLRSNKSLPYLRFDCAVHYDQSKSVINKCYTSRYNDFNVEFETKATDNALQPIGSI